MENKFANQPNTYNLESSKISDDDKFCILKFKHCDKKYPLEKLNKDELKHFIGFAKKIEETTWKDIKISKGFHFETIELLKNLLPNDVSKDINMTSLRVSKKFRIIGFRIKESYYIVGFDNNHESY